MHKSGKLNKYQLDCFITPRAAEELYDVVNDPLQFNNLAQNSDYIDELNEMRSLLDSWIIEFDDNTDMEVTPDKFDRWTGEKLKKYSDIVDTSL
jgi:hypothetical protein